jgi:hypothetical protein
MTTVVMVARRGARLRRATAMVQREPEVGVTAARRLTVVEHGRELGEVAGSFLGGSGAGDELLQGIGGDRGRRRDARHWEHGGRIIE